MENLINWAIAISLGILFGALIGAFAGLPIMFLWNWLIPTIFGLPTITFWQAIGLGVLSSILFKSFGGNSSK